MKWIVTATACAALWAWDAPARAEEFVVVRADAWLYTSASRTTGASARAVPPARGKKGGALAGMFVYRKVEDLGDGWLHVEPIAPLTARHCHPGLNGIAELELSLYVHQDDVLPVTSREVTIGYDDGTEVMLASGVAVLRRGRAHWIRVDDLSFDTAVPVAAFDYSYLPSLGFREDETDEHLAPKARPKLRGIDLVTLTGAAPFYVHGKDEHPGGVLVTLSRRCSRLKVVVASKHVSAGEPPLGRAPGAKARPVRPGPGHRLVTAGTPVYWSDGSTAGETRTDVRIHGEKVERVTDRFCLERKLHHATAGAAKPGKKKKGKGKGAKAGDDGFTFCFDERDVTLPAEGEDPLEGVEGL